LLQLASTSGLVVKSIVAI